MNITYLTYPQQRNNALMKAHLNNPYIIWIVVYHSFFEDFLLVIIHSKKKNLSHIMSIKNINMYALFDIFKISLKTEILMQALVVYQITSALPIETTDQIQGNYSKHSLILLKSLSYGKIFLTQLNGQKVSYFLIIQVIESRNIFIYI